MSKKLIESALNGPIGSNQAYFFRGDQYAVYDWNADRATQGTISIRDGWTFPDIYQRPGFISRFDAALSGHEPGVAEYQNHHYFFRAGKYVRFDWTSPRPLAYEFEGDSSAWRLPNPFNTSVDAILNGKFSRKGYSYFFKGPNYARYNWALDTVDVKPIASFAPGSMPAFFQSGIDAALDGDGRWADYGYLFKGDWYIRVNWDRNGTNPRIDNVSNIVGFWGGVGEFLKAGEAKSKAFEWLWAAKLQLDSYIDATKHHLPYLGVDLMHNALRTHFRLADPNNVPDLDAIAANLTKIELALHRPPTIFRYRNDEECRQDGCVIYRRNPNGSFQLDPAGNKIPDLDELGRLQPAFAAYARFDDSINFTRIFPLRGAPCSAAQIIHEATHFIDNNNDRPNDIPEWYVTDPVADTLGLPHQENQDPAEIGMRYDRMTAAVAMHNPSSYASFSQHLRYLTDTRYGEARQNPLPGLW